jgi:flavin-dependent dehydrogenase
VRDAVVVGGGPVGLATAIALRAKGLTVALFDRATPPIDKACGEGVMPHGVAALRRLGVCPDEDCGRPFVGVRYVEPLPGGGALVAEARFQDGTGLGVRRLQLQLALARRAEQVGVELHWGEAVSGVAHGGIQTGAGRFEARWIVGADGLHSKVRRWSGLEGKPYPDRRFGVRRHYAVEAWTDMVEVHWGGRADAYVTPVCDGVVGVAFLARPGRLHCDELLRDFPALAARLAGARPVSEERGAGPFRQRVKGLVAGNVVLVGDASGYFDAITGEGLSLGFQQGEALADALAAGDPARYVAAHARLKREPYRMIQLLLLLERHPGLRRRAIAALAAEPRVFQRFLAINDGRATLRSLGLGNAARFAWRMVAAGDSPA